MNTLRDDLINKIKQCQRNGSQSPEYSATISGVIDNL